MQEMCCPQLSGEVPKCAPILLLDTLPSPAVGSCWKLRDSSEAAGKPELWCPGQNLSEVPEQPWSMRLGMFYRMVYTPVCHPGATCHRVPRVSGRWLTRFMLLSSVHNYRCSLHGCSPTVKFLNIINTSKGLPDSRPSLKEPQLFCVQPSGTLALILFGDVNL